ncbi:MAG: threonylcarbamoyl-AMP synthase [Bdellovibrionaceae bacterium]|nr:threonylcarbamoyl-AMP synthase [Pseudobdellovibrionaceae bacterium]
MLSSEIKYAVNELSLGHVVGMPTETVYGLAARIDCASGIEAIFKIKERPFFDPLIVHISDFNQLGEVVKTIPEIAKILANTFWPGPLTLVLPRSQKLNSLITSGLDTVGVRMPSHPVALDLIMAAGVPLAAPSANKFGKTSPTTAAHVRNEFKRENIFVLDGGESQVGIESTVLLVRPKAEICELSILRKGHILKSDIENALKSQPFKYEFIEVADKNQAPGHMKHHYMPSVPLVLCIGARRPSEELREVMQKRLTELPDKIEEVAIVKPAAGIHRIAELVLDEDPVLAARKFYSQLRELAETKPDCILLYRLPSQYTERWESLFDRILKAASLVIP